MSTPVRGALPYRGRAWLFGVLLPIAITLVAAALVATWAPRLPDPVVTHWGSSGPDASGSLSSLVAPFAIYGAISLTVCGLFALHTGRTSMVRRLTAGTAMGLATLNAGLVLAAVHTQVGAATTAEVADPGSRIMLAALLAIAAAGVGMASAGTDPRLPATAPLPADALRAELEAGAAPVWQQTVAPSRRAQLWFPVGVLTLVLMAAGLTAASGSWWAGALLLLPAPLVLLLLVPWHVRVGPDGLTARAGLGRPRQHIPADEVELAEVSEVSPFGDFGGWGLRIAPDIHGTVGVVIRAGEAILVHRSAGRRFAVTVDDATTAVALLNTYAQRARTGSAHDVSPD